MSAAWEIGIFYDGECPLCSREIRLLERLDRGRGRLRLLDVRRPDFDAGEHGLDPAVLMARIHGVLPDGSIVDGMEVFRRAYGAVGLGWLLAPTRWPGVRRLADGLYRAFARNRLRLTGRRPGCPDGRCPLPNARVD